MSKISFIHCSDIHLGCQQFNEPQRWQDFAAVFQDIVEYAIYHKVDFVLVGGDLFHHRSINAPTLGQAINLLDKLKQAGIQVVAIEGNHDKAFYLEKDSWMNFLNQQGYIRLLKPEFIEGNILLNPYAGNRGCITEIEGVEIVGLGYLGATTRQRLEEILEQIKPTEAFRIVLLHAAVDKLLGQDLAGVKKEVLNAFSGLVDYFALGHVHSRQEIDELIYNPGAPECVHIDEAKEGKEKGFYHVKISGKNKDVRFIASKHRVVRRLAIDLTSIAVPGQVAAKVLEYLSNTDLAELDKPILQLNLFGIISFSSYVIDTEALADLVRETYNCLFVEVLNNTNLPLVTDNVDMTSFDREALEKKVLSQMISEEKPQWKEINKEIVDLMLQIKNDTLAGLPEEDILTALMRFVDTIPLAEVAVGNEEGENNEN